jgi:hypothetical protein
MHFMTNHLHWIKITRLRGGDLTLANIMHKQWHGRKMHVWGIDDRGATRRLHMDSIRRFQHGGTPF